MPKVLFVLSRFPCYDEAFLLRELAALAERLDLYIFSLRRSHDPVVHDEALALLPRTLRIPYLVSWRLLRAHLRTLRRRPRQYLRALRGLLAGTWRSPEFLLKNLVFFPKAVYLADWAEGNGITHLHAGWATYPASAALVATEIAGLPFSFSGHAHDIYLDTTQLAEKLRRAAFVTTCTKSNRAHLLRLAPGLPPERVAVVHHGIRLAAFAPVPQEQGPLSILSVGTLYPHKGMAVLLDAFACLAGEGLDFRGTIVGGGPLEAALREQVRRLGLEDRVTLTGARKQSEVIPLFRRASVFVLLAQPEWHWGIPNVIVEALAARNAVVTTRFGSVEELVRDGETGLLVPPKDPAAVARAIGALATDLALRARLAEAGHALVRGEFDLEGAVRFYLRRFQGRPAAPPDPAGV